jgi:YegS/Rv2252/BmrU family lipid kinase
MQLVNSETWLIIVNPNAGHGMGKKDWSKIEVLLQKYQIPYQHRFTEAKHHAIHIVCEAIQRGFRKFVAVGGDGTMNEIVNGCFTQKYCEPGDLILAMIMVGTGNDWGKMFGIPASYDEAIKIILANNYRLQDTGVVYYFHGTKREKRYFINIAGLGFDAVVVRKTNRQKEMGRSGKFLYFWNLLQSLLFYRHTKVEIEIDGKKISDEVFTISLGIGKYSGGGMMQTPNAIVDDGLFDITVVKRMRKGEIVRNLKMLYDGSILDHPKIEGYTGKDILIDSDPLIHLEADGESLGHSPIEFNIIPKSINVVCGRFPGK